MIDGTALTQVAPRCATTSQKPVRWERSSSTTVPPETSGASRPTTSPLTWVSGRKLTRVVGHQLARRATARATWSNSRLAEADGLARSGRSGAEQHATTLGSGLARARPVHRHPVRGPRDRVDMEDRQGADGRVVERRHCERAAAGGHHREDRLRGRVRVERHDGGPRADQADEQGAEGHRVGRQQAHPLAGDTVGPPPRHARRQLRPVDDPVAPGRLQPRHRRGGRGLRRHHPCEDPLSLF